MEMDSKPEELDELERRIMQLEIEREAITREKDEKKLGQLNEEIANLSAERDELKSKWQTEKDVVEAIQEKKGQLEQLKIEMEQAKRNGDFGRASALQYGLIHETEKAVENLSATINGIHANSPMLKATVTGEDNAEIGRAH